MRATDFLLDSRCRSWKSFAMFSKSVCIPFKTAAMESIHKQEVGTGEVWSGPQEGEQGLRSRFRPTRVLSIQF